MMPVYKQIMDAHLVDQVKREHFAPGPKNSKRTPVYSYVVTTFVTLPAFSMHPSQFTQERAQQANKKLQALCEIPDFVARVARATSTPHPDVKG